MSIEFCLFLAFFGRLDFFKCRFGRFDVDFDRSLSTRIFLDQRWPESLFQTLTPLLLQYFWIRVRIPVWQFFKFENPTPVQTPATIDPTVIFPCFYLRNDHTDSCFCRNWKVTPVRIRFSQIFGSSSGCGSEWKTQNPAGVDSCNLDLVSSEISDFTPCTHAQSNVLQTKYADKTDY